MAGFVEGTFVVLDAVVFMGDRHVNSVTASFVAHRTMRCSVARLCERTVGRRVPQLGAGGGQLHTTPHCVVVTAWLVRSWRVARATLIHPFVKVHF